MKMLKFIGALLLTAVSLSLGAPEPAVMIPALMLATIAAICLVDTPFAGRATPRSIFETRRAGLA